MYSLVAPFGITYTRFECASAASVVFRGGWRIGDGVGQTRCVREFLSVALGGACGACEAVVSVAPLASVVSEAAGRQHGKRAEATVSLFVLSFINL
jgi:hypothetical protein